MPDDKFTEESFVPQSDFTTWIGQKKYEQALLACLKCTCYMLKPENVP